MLENIPDDVDYYIALNETRLAEINEAAASTSLDGIPLSEIDEESISSPLESQSERLPWTEIPEAELQQILDERANPDNDDELLASSQHYLSQLIGAQNAELQQHSTEGMSTDHSRFTVVELREKLKALGLATNGKKADLIARIESQQLT